MATGENNVATVNLVDSLVKLTGTYSVIGRSVVVSVSCNFNTFNKTTNTEDYGINPIKILINVSHASSVIFLKITMPTNMGSGSRHKKYTWLDTGMSQLNR